MSKAAGEGVVVYLAGGARHRPDATSQGLQPRTAALERWKPTSARLCGRSCQLRRRPPRSSAIWGLRRLRLINQKPRAKTPRAGPAIGLQVEGPGALNDGSRPVQRLLSGHQAALQLGHFLPDRRPTKPKGRKRRCGLRGAMGWHERAMADTLPSLRHGPCSTNLDLKRWRSIPRLLALLQQPENRHPALRPPTSPLGWPKPTEAPCWPRWPRGRQPWGAACCSAPDSRAAVTSARLEPSGRRWMELWATQAPGLPLGGFLHLA